ncbi:MAG: hypothetical protein RLZZ387_2361 [Chloroflexota bacterium]
MASERDTIHPLAAATPRDPLLRYAAVFLGYLALAVLVTWPLALDLQGAAVQKGDIPVDAGQGIWNLWWARESLLRGWNPYLTRHIYFPQPVNLFYQTLSLPNALLVFPVLWAFGPVAAFNAVGLLSFVLGGTLAYGVARTLVGPAAALLGGFVYAFSAYHMQLAVGGPMEMVAIHWIPFYVLVLMRALRHPTLLGWLAAASALTLTTLASSYYGLFLAVYTAAHAGLVILGRRPVAACGWWRAPLGAALLYAVWAGALLLFTGAPRDLDASLMGDWYERQVFQAAALVDYLALNPLHPVWGAWSAATVSALSPAGAESGAAIGYTVYALAALGLLRRRDARPWGALALLAFLLSLGPELKLTAEPTGVPLPYALLDLLAPFRNSTRPNYWIGVLMLPLSVLAACGSQALLGARKTSNEGRATRVEGGRATVFGLRSSVFGLWSLVFALLLFELWPRPLPLLPLAADPLYAAMAADALPGAVLELPARTNDSRAMVSQLCHGRPLAGGYLARTPDYPPINGASAVRRLWFAEPGQPDIFAHDPAGELATLGVRYVTIDVDQISRGRAGRLRSLLEAPGVALAAATPGLEVYAVDPGAARPAVLPGAGWYEPESDGTRVWRWMRGAAELRLLARAPARVALELPVTAYGRARALQITLGGTLLAEMQAPAAPASSVVRLLLVLPAGEHRLTLRSEAERAPDGRQISLSVGPVRLTGGALPTEPGQRVVAAPPTLGGVPRLCGP